MRATISFKVFAGLRTNLKKKKRRNPRGGHSSKKTVIQKVHEKVLAKKNEKKEVCALEVAGKLAVSPHRKKG
jgi:hypothetical protein